MATRSLVGALDPDGITYRARYCHFDGYPANQLRELGIALYRYHGGDLTTLVRILLDHDWSALKPDEATSEHHAGQSDSTGPGHIKAMLGIGRYYTDGEQHPRIDTLTAAPHGGIEWMYLFTADGRYLRVLRADGDTWVLDRNLPVADLDRFAHSTPTDEI